MSIATHERTKQRWAQPKALCGKPGMQSRLVVYPTKPTCPDCLAIIAEADAWIAAEEELAR